MRISPHFPVERRVRMGAFTLLEMLVAVTILTVIIFGLFSMFNQTQRAFRASVTQVDVMESGRSAVDLLARELEQVAATHVPGYTNLYFTPNGNISGGPANLTNNFSATSLFGTNGSPSIHDFFFVTQSGNLWTGLGYFVDRASTNYNEDANLFNAGVGTLYRFSTTTNSVSGNNLPLAFANSKPAQYQRVTDGILHIRLRAFSPSGVERGATSFTGDDLPAFIDLEVAILESRFVAEAKGRGSVANIQSFLSTPRVAGAVHLFRQRISLKSAPQ